MKKHILKRALALLTILAMLIPCMPIIAAADSSTVTATQWNPDLTADAAYTWLKANCDADGDGVYVLDSFTDLAYFMACGRGNSPKNFSGETVTLGGDIPWNKGTATKNGFTLADDATTFYYWEPYHSAVATIAGSTETSSGMSLSFAGTFDGKGYSISGLYVNETINYKNVGFFAGLKDATVKNLCFENTYMKGCTTHASRGVAIVAGSCYNTCKFENITLKNCHAEGLINVGGIVGSTLGEWMGTKPTYKNCVLDNQSTVTGSENVGGIMGHARTKNVVTVTNCVNYAEITGTANVLGLIGYPQSTAITYANSASFGRLTVGELSTVSKLYQNGANAVKLDLDDADNGVMTVEGVQTRENQTDKTKFDARFIVSIDFDAIDPALRKSDFKQFGFEAAELGQFANKTANAVKNGIVETVYTSIESRFGNVEIKGLRADQSDVEYVIDADYLATMKIEEIPAEGIQTVLVRSYYATKTSNEAIYGGYIAVTFVNGEILASTQIASVDQSNSLAIAVPLTADTYDMATLFPNSTLTVKKGGVAQSGTTMALATGVNDFEVTIVKDGMEFLYNVSIARRDKHRVVFNSNGGSYIATKYVADGESIAFDSSVKPTHVRYSKFTGWFNDAGTKVALGQTPITSDLVLTARWENLKNFGSNHSSYLSYTTSSAALNIAWKDYDNAFGYRPDSVTCTLSDGTNSYKVTVTKTSADFVGAKPTGATISQGAGDWTVKIKGLTKDYTFVQDAMNNEHYTTIQSGTSVEHTMVGYAPAHDSTAALMTENGRFYDHAGNVIVLKGVVTLNVGWQNFPGNTSMSALTRLKEEGVNCIRVTMMTGSATDSDSTGYLNASKRASLMATLDVAIQNATALGMYCIVDFGVLMTRDNANSDAYLSGLEPYAIDLFETLAEDYINNPYVLFEVCNEPAFTKTNPWSEHIKPFEEAIIDAIREKGSKAVIIAAPNMYARRLSDTYNDDPINKPFDTTKSHNVAFSYHNYSYTLSFNNGENNHGWRFSDGIKAGLTIVATEFSPATASIDAQSNSVLLSNTKEADKYLNLMLENDVSYMLFRYTSTGTAEETSSQHMFTGGNNSALSGGTWTYGMLSDSGKWFYDRTLNSTGFIKAADFTYVKPEDTTDKCAICGETEYCKICGLCTDCVTKKYSGECGGYSGICQLINP